MHGILVIIIRRILKGSWVRSNPRSQGIQRDATHLLERRSAPRTIKRRGDGRFTRLLCNDQPTYEVACLPDKDIVERKMVGVKIKHGLQEGVPQGALIK